MVSWPRCSESFLFEHRGFFAARRIQKIPPSALPAAADGP
jgi:hypothetical protein